VASISFDPRFSSSFEISFNAQGPGSVLGSSLWVVYIVHTYVLGNILLEERQVVLVHFVPSTKNHSIDPGGPFLTSPLAPGVNLAPGGEFCRKGGMFTPLFPPGVNTLLFRRMEGLTENFTPGDNFTTMYVGDKIHPWGTTLPLG
jgi:hypothetical protein